MLEEVKKGMAWLNKNKPGWWREESIDLKALDLNRCNRCILGQLFGDYYKGLEEGYPFPSGSWKEMNEWAQDRGFIIPERYNLHDVANWMKLSDVWRSEVAKLRGRRVEK